jgi:hypothetical protein
MRHLKAGQWEAPARPRTTLTPVSALGEAD